MIEYIIRHTVNDYTNTTDKRSANNTVLSAVYLALSAIYSCSSENSLSA